jgi:uroporphyrinogen-III synthase
MTDPEPTLLLTRPEAQSKAFLISCEKAAGRRLPAIISPVMSISHMGELPDLDNYATIIFTSGNGVKAALETTSLKGRRIATVGQRTAELAQSAGASAVSLGDDVEAFLGAIDELAGPVLLCRGTHTRGNLAERMRQAGLSVDEAVIYDQETLPLSVAARSLLAGDAPVIAPVFSPRSASLLAGYGVVNAPITVVAMSRNVAEAWTGPGKIVIADKPTSDAMCELTVSYF